MPEQRTEPQRYEPLPGFLDLPGWLWRKTPRPGRFGLVAAVIALIVTGIVIGPGIRESNEERERALREERLQAKAERDARIRRQQRPRFFEGPAATAGVAARQRLLDAAAASVLADARRRAAAGELRGPIDRVACEPFPRNVAGVGAEDSTTERFGRYACLGVTAEFFETDASSGGRLGHPYRMRIDFDTGRYALCKIAGRPAEGQLKRDPGPTVPRACGGGP